MTNSRPPLAGADNPPDESGVSFHAASASLSVSKAMRGMRALQLP